MLEGLFINPKKEGKIDTIFIDNLIVEGIQGLGAKEKRISQKFRVDAEIKINSGAHLIDKIESTFDYKIARDIIFEVFKNESFNLLETLAERIAQRILEKPRSESIKITIRKIEIWNNGVPGITIIRQKVPKYLDLFDFDAEKMINDLCKIGGASFPVLGEDRRLKLVEEARKLAFVSQLEIVGGGKVREELSSVDEFPKNSLFWKLKNDFTELLIRKLKFHDLLYIFEIPPVFNNMSLQKYEKGSVGITPHIDGKSRINLIFVFILCGRANFAVCQNRTGSNPKFLDASPGNAIVIRGPGFFKSSFQPFHFVKNITEERIVFGLRQKINKDND